MKLEAIRVGGLYTDNKQGVREVLEIGPHIRTHGADPSALGVRYRVLSAAKQPDIGSDSDSELRSFAAWARAEVTAKEANAFAMRQAAARILKRLTAPQRAFFASIDSDCGPACEIECNRDELRVAKACFEKGLLSAAPDTAKAARYFYVTLSALGLAVLALVCNEASQA